MQNTHLHDTHKNGLPDRSAALYPAGTVLEELRELNHRRVNWLRAANRLRNQCFGVCMGYCDGDKKEAERILKTIENGTCNSGAALACAPLMAARIPLDEARNKIENEMKRLARRLPVWQSWGAGVKGFGELTLAKILAGAGDLGEYANPAKLWKRMGLALVDGERQRRVGGDVEKAVRHGYSAERRSDIWNAIEPMVKHVVTATKCEDGSPLLNEFGETVSLPLTPYGEYFVAERQRQRDKLRGTKECYLKHALERAKRHLGKRILRDLWRAWRACGGLALNQPAGGAAHA